MTVMSKKSFDEPDEVRNPKEDMRVEFVEMGGLRFRRHTASPGYKGQNCDIDHLLFVISGNFHARMPDGQESHFGPGEIAVIPPGHDAWNDGDEPVVWLEIPH
ncbi:MAG TPA: cupin domain-containing protein [Actinomycetota bacterium]|nr:cupin domain-containing protein [Actinomycetota bacterium]